jgi:hypothetical protein
MQKFKQRGRLVQLIQNPASKKGAYLVKLQMEELLIEAKKA